MVNELSEDSMLAVEPIGLNEGQEELRAVGVGASVSHGQQSGDIVLVVEVFILELGTVDRLSSSAVTGGEIASLGHEVGDNSVELAVLVVEDSARFAGALLTGAEASEVLSGFGDFVGEEFELEFLGGTINGKVQENNWIAVHLFALF